MLAVVHMPQALSSQCRDICTCAELARRSAYVASRAGAAEIGVRPYGKAVMCVYCWERRPAKEPTYSPRCLGTSKEYGSCDLKLLHADTEFIMPPMHSRAHADRLPTPRKDPIAALLYILPSKTHHAFSKVPYNASLCGGIFARNVFSQPKTIHKQMPLTQYHKDPPWPLRSAQ